MHDHDNQNGSTGQGGMNSETEQRNQENETGQQGQAGQSGQAQFTGQEQMPDNAQQTDTLTPPQTGEKAGDETAFDQADAGQQTDQGGTGFVGTGTDQSSDYLTKGENQDFQPEGQGASDADAGTADITTGQPTSSDSTLDDGSDTSR